jgi:hypothetical protein
VKSTTPDSAPESTQEKVATALQMMNIDEGSLGVTNEHPHGCGGEVFRFIDTGHHLDTVAILMGWWGSRDSHMKAYSGIYTSVGINTVRFTASSSSIFWNPDHLAKELLSFLHRHGLHERKVLFHMWSNGGSLVYCRILDHLKTSSITGMRCVVGELSVLYIIIHYLCVQ